MSYNTIERLFQLEAELAALKNDPRMQELLAKKEQLVRKVSDLGFSEAEAAALLAPEQASSSAPLVQLTGISRIPGSPVKKRLLQSNLIAVRSEIDHLLERLEKDSAIQQRAHLISATQELGLTMAEGAELLSPGIMSHQPEKKARRVRRDRTWKNPHTGETVKARSTNNKTLRAWSAEHGNAILNDWLINVGEKTQS